MPGSCTWTYSNEFSLHRFFNHRLGLRPKYILDLAKLNFGTNKNKRYCNSKTLFIGNYKEFLSLNICNLLYNN